MKHNNISVFVPHIGCPNMCSFCNQHIISGSQKAPSAEDIRSICMNASEEIKEPENTEIAFFGGSFTAIPKEYMIKLLEAAQDFIGLNKFRGIRISTRPDCISEEILQILKNYGVTSIELGAQSMKDHVLAANDRGHTSADVVNASRLIKKFGFELGLQMMVGLYKSSESDEFETVEKILKIHPDTVRIYPVVILKGTKLAALLRSGEYVPFSFDKAVEISSISLLRFEDAGIRVIKCGLHASEFVENDMIGGFYHPAFRELCESRIYRSRIEELIAKNPTDAGMYVIAVDPSCISKAAGHKRCNTEYFKQCGSNVKIVGDKNIPKYQCELRR